MLVGDEPALVRVGKLMLERLRFVVAVFTDRRRAWEAFAANPDSYDLVIRDQTMPRLTGLELATRMLRSRPNLPIILATGYHPSPSPGRVREAGVAELLMKPFTLETLTNAIRTVLGPTAA